MEIKEKLQYYAENINKKDYIKISELEEEVRRYIKRVIKQQGYVEFNSNDVSKLADSIKDVLNNINDELQFENLLNIISAQKNITVPIFNKCMENTVENMAVNRELQRLYSLFSYMALVLHLLEIQYKQENEADSELLTNELALVIKDYLKGIY